MSAKILKTTNVQQVRFMARSAASYILMLDEQSSQAQNVLHKNAFSDEAAPVFISLRRGKPFYFAMKHCSVTLHNMKHSAYAPYDLKMKNESCVCKYSLSMLHYSAERKILMEKSSNKLADLSVAFACIIWQNRIYYNEMIS